MYLSLFFIILECVCQICLTKARNIHRYLFFFCCRYLREERVAVRLAGIRWQFGATLVGLYLLAHSENQRSGKKEEKNDDPLHI